MCMAIFYATFCSAVQLTVLRVPTALQASQEEAEGGQGAGGPACVSAQASVLGLRDGACMCMHPPKMQLQSCIQ